MSMSHELSQSHPSGWPRGPRPAPLVRLQLSQPLGFDSARGGAARPGFAGHFVGPGTRGAACPHLDPACGWVEAHTMHACGNTKQVKSRVKAMKNKAKSCNTACNTRSACAVAGQTGGGSAPHGPCGALPAPLGPKRSALRRPDGAPRSLSAPLGTCGAVRLRRRQ